MKGYDINKIDLIDTKEPKIEELLTGDVVKGLDPNSPIKSNAEIEKGEWMQYPEGDVVQVVGRTHETGGVKMNIPDGTKVISHNLKLTKDQAKVLARDYKIDVSTKDTYATAIERYSKKIGLAKLNSQQEDAFAALKKELNKDNKEGTARVNNQYLSSKINDLENSKKSLEKERSTFFNKVFDMQESTKTGEKDSEDTFKNGGISQKNFENLCKRYNITPDQGQQMLRDGGYKSNNMYDDGGYKITPEEQKIIDEKWAGKKDKYIAYKKVEKAILENKELRQELFKNYGSVIEDDKSYTGSTKGKGLWKGALENRSEQEVIDALLAQEERNARLEAFGLDPKETSQGTAKGARTNQETLDFIAKNPGLKDLNFSKGYLGQAAYLAYDQTVKTDKFKKNYNVSQSGKNDERGNTTISGIENDSTDTTLGQRVNYIAEPDKPADPAKTEDKTEDKTDPAAKEGAMNDKVVTPNDNNSGMYMGPTYRPLAPSPLQSNYKTNIDYREIDPIKVGIENNLAAVSDERQAVADQLKDLPDSQRASTLASLLASSQKANNQAITAANITNAQNQTTADQYNNEVFNQNSVSKETSALEYEDRVFQGMANQEEALNKYYEANQINFLNEYQNAQDMKTLETMSPDYVFNPGGGVTYTPNGNFQVNGPNLDSQEEVLKTEEEKKAEADLKLKNDKKANKTS